MSELEPVVEIAHAIRHCIFALIEKQLKHLAASRANWIHFVIIAISTGLLAYFFMFLGLWLAPTISEPAPGETFGLWDRFTHHPLHMFTPLFAAAFSGLVVFLVAWKSYFSTLEKETREAFPLLNQIIRDRRIGGEGLATIEGVMGLPRNVRDALNRFLKLDLMKREWGHLYLTFAINLQLDPWEGAGTNGFVLVRDRAQVRRTPGSHESAFNQLLERDLAIILSLVNGSLWSVMYRDMIVWKNPRYYRANQELRQRKEPDKLRRLFVYEEDWLQRGVKLVPMLVAARWHKEQSYHAKFVSREKATGSILTTADSSLASCLVNRTVIQMEGYHDTSTVAIKHDPGIVAGQRSSGIDAGDRDSVYIRYLYECDSQEGCVNNYRDDFTKAWNNGVCPDDFEKEVSGRGTDFVQKALNEARDKYQEYTVGLS